MKRNSKQVDKKQESWPTLLSVLVVSLALVTADAQIEFYPANTSLHREGDSVKIICSSEKSPMDVLRIYKKVGNTSYPLSTEGLLTHPFGDNARYAMMVTSDDGEAGGRRSVELTITGLQGEDSGTIECVHVPISGEETTAMEEFKVLVAPKKVQLMTYNGGVLSPAEDTVMLEEGHDHGLACYVVADGTTDEPQTSITLGENDGSSRDVTSWFIREQNHTFNANGGLVQRKKSILYQYLTNREPNAAELHDRVLTCTSSLPQMKPKTASAKIQVRFQPKLKCEAANAELDEDVVLICRASMFPALQLASVSWSHDEDNVALTRDSLEHGRHSLQIHNTSMIDHEFMVTIKGVTAGDFINYKFEISNALGSSKKKVKLIQVQSTTTSATTKAKTDKPEAEVPNKPGSSIGAAGQLLSSVVLVLVAAVLSSWS